ncbi:hypothetical protein BN988_02189 [Oceanobacillus picturae]|uniref:Oligosaccharide repeat unit polymerase n=1 Tax=Oceanobacillus picturae TaxID=171693 RepID=W9ALZ4_9BACI|nr:O-antigen polymerase [Oceanobacillus picturae]CDO03671.1 hypothetical protein BN988_02189 [Oceanobacillus picturae]
MVGLAIVIHLFIIVLGISFVIYDYKRRHNNKLSVFMGTNLVFTFIYGLIPAILILNDFFVGKTDFYLIYTIDKENEPYLYISIVILIGYICMLLGYFLSNPYKRYKQKFYIPRRYLKYVAFSLLLVSSFCVFYFFVSMGGFINSFKYIEAIRAGNINIPGPIFLLLPVSIVSFLIYLSFQLDKVNIFSINFLFLLISLINSIYYLLIFGGRLPIALFILIIPMYIMERKGKWGFKNLFLIFIVGVLSLNYLDSLFKLLSQSSDDIAVKSVLDNIPRLIAQFSFPYINTLHVHDFTYSNIEFRYFIDLISWIINYLPSNIASVIGLDQITPSYTLNTENHLMFDPSNKTAGGVPTDIVTFGYYQFSIVGVIIITFLFGLLVSWFDRFFNNSHQSTFITLAKIRLFQVISFYPMYADIEAFMRRRIDVVLIIVLLVLFSKKHGEDSSQD